MYNLLLVTKETNEHIVGKEISRHEYLELIVKNKELEFLDDFDRAWRILYINLINQKNYCQKLLELYVKPKIPLTKENLELTKRIMNVDLFNILSSFYFYIQFIETNFSRYFGKDSEELAFAKALFSKYYDNSFEYRFFYHLRHYVVHCGLPIQLVYNAYESPEKSNLAILFSKHKLLSDYKKWKHVTEDLKKDGNDIPVITTSINFAQMIPKIHKEILNYLTEKFKPSLEFMESYFKQVDSDSNSMSILETDENGVELETQLNLDALKLKKN